MISQYFYVAVCWMIVKVIAAHADTTILADEAGYCAPYNGKICKSFIKSTQVFYSGNGGWENEKVATGLFAELIEDLEDICQKPASKLLCAYAFPKCKVIDGLATKMPLCFEDCIAVKQLYCYNYWVLLEEKKTRGVSLKTRGHFRLPDCETLPKYNKKFPNCSYVGLTEMNQQEVSCKKILSFNLLNLIVIFR